jgi:hypothetical protein
MFTVLHYNQSLSVSTIQDLINLESTVTHPTDFEGISIQPDSNLITIGKTKLGTEINTGFFSLQI